ncbi:hypothetical protein KW807_01800 [Candidatus Parcubacteria bacterium]|nr:hypothetical protein [Candidatus Parcubacteria bacterium]
MNFLHAAISIAGSGVVLDAEFLSVSVARPVRDKMYLLSAEFHAEPIGIHGPFVVWTC